MYLTIILLAFVFFIFFRFKALKKEEQETIESFWEREQKANFSPKKDLSNLSYITIPFEKFPQTYIDSEEEKMFSELKAFSDKKILNLNGLSNTDLKEQYGVANLNTLEEIGDNFDSISKIIAEIAEKRFEIKDYSVVITLLEFLVSKKTDLSKAYIILGDAYSETNKYSKIPDLITIVKELHLPLEKKILDSLSSHLKKIEKENIEIPDL